MENLLDEEAAIVAEFFQLIRIAQAGEGKIRFKTVFSVFDLEIYISKFFIHDIYLSIKMWITQSTSYRHKNFSLLL